MSISSPTQRLSDVFSGGLAFLLRIQWHIRAITIANRCGSPVEASLWQGLVGARAVSDGPTQVKSAKSRRLPAEDVDAISSLGSGRAGPKGYTVVAPELMP